MKPFLKQVAEHYYALGGVERTCFIFPNRRADAFFRKYLGECVAESRQALMAPPVYTMKDFFYAASGLKEADQITLLLELFGHYSKLNPAHESLDDFIFWGGVLLSDFNDIDKYLVKAESLFSNIADLREMQDDYTYLDETQREAIKRFVSHFQTGGRYKDEFRRIWDILLPLYRAFNESLSAKGLSYEGKVYRALAERLSGESVADVLAGAFGKRADKFVFVGLNALNECEKRLMRKMRDAGLAEFCWDYVSPEIRAPHNKSSFFMADNVLEFPQAFTPEGGDCTPEINVLSVPSAVGQAKQLPSILDRLGARGIETAVVLPDEAQLIPVLNSLPEHISDINVTMGYPMRGSSLWTLMNDIAALQLHLRQKGGEWFFYHKQVWAIFSNSIVKSIISEKGLETVAKVKQDARYYVPQSELAGDRMLELIFRPVVTQASVADAQMTANIGKYQREVIAGIAPSLKDVPDMAMELDFAREYYLGIGQLMQHPLEVLPLTWFRLVEKLVGGSAVPFKGEPLNGLQIMGPLETRALDFDNLVILNCNEGIFPRRNVSASFVPAELRRGFGLPTYEYQDAVWAYYFYRMIQRPRRIWLLYDSTAQGLRNGEESRYIKQLELDFGFPLRRYVAKAPIEKHIVADSIDKIEEDIRTLREKKRLSATALENYLDCQAKFYYATVKGLREKEEVAEFMDGGKIGNAFHRTMEAFYSVPSRSVSRDYLKGLLSGDIIRDEVHRQVLEQINSFEVSGRDLVYEDMICQYVRKTVEKDIALMDSRGIDSIRILGLEKRCSSVIGGFQFTGFIDRLDSLVPGEVRVVDYKTGTVTDDDYNITDDNAGAVVDKLFGPKSDGRPKIAFQVYLYDRFVREDPKYKGFTVANSIYQPCNFFVKDVECYPLSEEFYSLMDAALERLLAEIADLSIPFARTSDTEKVCRYCDFKTLCGR